MHTAQDGEPAGSLSYETDPLVRIDLTTYNRVQWVACLPSLIHCSAVPRLL